MKKPLPNPPLIREGSQALDSTSSPSPDKGRPGGISSCAALPPGWIETSLDSLLELVIGGDWGKEPDFDDEDFVPVFCIRGSEFRYWNAEKGKTASLRKVKDSSLEKRKLKEGDILIEISGGGPDQPVGRTVLIDESVLQHNKHYPKVCTNFIRLARPDDRINSKYLNYYLHSFYLSGEVVKYQGGSNNLRNLKFKEYISIGIPLAPANEQIRIANKLDSLLAKVETAQTRLEKIPALLKRFRQAVLAAATSGELTREWRDASVKQVSDQFLTWNFVSLPSTWTLKLLPEVGESRLGKMLDKNKNEGIPTKYLANLNVRWGNFDLGDLKEIKVSKDEQEELSIKDGDLLLCEGGVPGRGAVWRSGVNDLVFQKAIHRVRFHDSIVPEYVLFCIEDDFNQNRLNTLYTGTTIKHLTGQALKKYPIKVPPMDEQAKIVRRVESLFAMADTVERQYQAAKARLDKLTQAILAKAFRGELVPQDPDDEPASVLLQRINAEKHNKYL